MVREALARVLEDSGRVQVVGQASNASETLRAAEQLRPQVVVVDYSMPDQDAPGTTEKLLRLQPPPKVIVLTVHENLHYAVRVLESGAHGYLVKSDAVEELVEAIESVCRGGIYISRKLAAEVLQHLRRPRRERVGLEALSQREFDFLRLLGSGKSLQQAARQMNISTSTASTYRARIMDKLSLQTTAELIRFALEHGFAG